MTWQGFMQIFVLVAVVAAVGWLLSRYMYAALEAPGGRTFMDRVLVPCERGVYRLLRVDPTVEMRWTTYVFTLLAVNAMGFVVLIVLIALQPVLPLDPAHLPHVPFWVNLNTAISFMTNTNWQAYGGESTQSYLSQMWLTVQQFLSPVTGICLFLAVARGFSRHSVNTLGNFWRDFIRTLLWVAIPIAIIGAIVLMGLGSVENIHAYTVVHTLQGGRQVIAQGPVASYESIASLGDNGGGFMNTNVGHPFAGPNAAAALWILILGFSVPVACIFMFGKIVNDRRQSWPIFATMTILFVVGAVVMYVAEAAGNPALAAHHIILAGSQNMVGKDTRFGIGESTLFNNSTTAVSWGAVSASNDSMTPIGGLVPLFNMMTGEVIFGSWGAGMIGMIAYAVLAMFLSGLMIGRTPEYLGKKIEAFEVKMAVLSLVVPSLVILVLAAISVAIKPGTSGIFNPGPHGLSEVLYTFSSGVGNNGSAFGGLNAASPWYAATVGLAMLFGRFPMYIPLVAMGASLARKQKVPVSAGTFPTHGPLFTMLLTGTVVIVGALIFFPALALGPFAEQFAAHAGHLFG